MQLNILLLIISLVLLDIGIDPIQSSQIVGGNNAKEHEFPWIVGLYVDGRFNCGGTLIELDLVLTAAHCVVGEENTNFTVHAGQHNLNNEEETAQTRIAIFFATYPFYNKAMLTNDIALIKLESKFKKTKSVKTILLPESDFNENYYETGQVAGWGEMDGGTENDGILKKVEMPIFKLDECKEIYLNTKPDNAIVTPYQLCGKKGRGPCYGDSGGPFLCMPSRGWFSSKNDYIFCGIVSYAQNCRQAEYPAVYTKVSSYLTWIQRTKEIFPASSASVTQVFVGQQSFICSIILFYVLSYYFPKAWQIK